MNTIFRSLMRTWYLIIIGLPLCVIIVFNIYMRANFELSARRELKNTIGTMENIINASTETDELQVINQLVAALTSSKISANTSFYLLHDKEVIFSSTQAEENLGESIVIYSGSNATAKKIETDDYKYYISEIELNGYEGVDNASMIFATKINDEIMYNANAMLIIVSLLIGSICAWYSYKMTKKISIPIEKACDYARRIGEGEFITIDEDEKIVEIYKLHNSFNQMSEKLKEADEDQKKVYQNISHEFRNPLMSIQGYSEGIEKGIIKDVQSAATNIKNESLRLNDLVSELLMISRMDNKNYEMNIDTYSIEDVIGDCMVSVNGMAITRDVELSLKVDKNFDVNIDVAMFSRAVINVLSNCIKYACKSVMVHCYEDDRKFIDICDDGEGVLEKDIPHIFERFYKGEKGNFGLGLAITYEVMELHGGSILVIPQEEKANNDKKKVIFRFVL